MYGSHLFALKPEDVFGGLIHQLEGPTIEGKKRVIIDSNSWEDMFPNKEPMAYWMLLRLFADIVWQKGILPWEKMRSVVEKLKFDWPEVKKRLNPDTAQLQIADLQHSSEKALLKALSDDPWTTMILMTDEDAGNGYHGIGLYKFYPHIQAIYQNTTLWSTFIAKLENKPEAMDGVEYLLGTIKETHELVELIKIDQAVFTDDSIRDWFIKTIIE
jgi:hypothetical protein